MSYWVYLEKDGEAVSVDSFQEGGTQVMGGSDEAALNITYNYSEVYQIFAWSIKDLHEKKAKDCIDTLEGFVQKFGTREYRDYWAPTPGNAGRALATLLKWAKQYPDAVFRVS